MKPSSVLTDKLKVANNLTVSNINLNGNDFNNNINVNNLETNNANFSNLIINGININNEIDNIIRELDIIDRTKYKNFNNIKTDRMYNAWGRGANCIKHAQLNVQSPLECKNICSSRDDAYIYEYYKNKICWCKTCRDPNKIDGDISSLVVESGVMEYKDVEGNSTPIETSNECFTNIGKEHMTVIEATNNIYSVYNTGTLYVNNMETEIVNSIETNINNNLILNGNNIESNLNTQNISGNTAKIKKLNLNGVDILQTLDSLKCRLNKRKKRNV